MLSSLRVQNFRLFQDLRLSAVGRVNLIVGKNNAGKSCLLEALRLYGSSCHAGVVRQVIRDRHEDVGLYVEPDAVGIRPEDAVAHPFRNLFPEYSIPEDLSTTIQIGPDDADGPVEQLQLSAYNVSSGERGFHVLRPLDGVRLSEVPPGAVLRLDHLRQDGDEQTFIGHLPWAAEAPRRRTSGDLLAKVRHVAAGGWDDDALAERWDRVAVAPTLKGRILEGLRLIDPDIQDLVVLSQPRPALEPVVVYQSGRHLPLRALGDGMGRLFQVLLALVAADGGLVLIDELENGLHWSVQPLAWRLVFQLAAHSNTQVFATTHSLDCVRAFQEVGAERQSEEGVLIHLGRSVRASERGRVIASVYGGGALARMSQAGMELR